MATTQQVQPITAQPQPIQLPALSLPAYQRLTEALVYDLRHVAGSEPRIRRGAGDLTSRRILSTAETGVYLFEAGDGRDYYQTTSFACSCPDAQQRKMRCRHAYSVTLYHAAVTEARFARLTSQYELTAKGSRVVTDGAA